MKMNETYRKFPIKFYKNPDGSIYYDCRFMHGTVKSLDDAFSYFSKNDWETDLIYYYDDVTDVQFGAFEPALTDKKVKGRVYLGKINLTLNIDTGWGSGEHSVTYLSQHPEAHEDQIKFIKKLKREAEVDKLVQKLKSGFKRVAGMFSKNEMFFPEKTRDDLICEHCGEIIPTGTYYELYANKAYHLECIWDKFCNNKRNNTLENARNFFYGLQKFVGNWPESGYDIQDDYEFDMDLVKANNRKLGLFVSKRGNELD